MGAQSRNVIVATCDNPKCKVQHVSAVEGEAEAKFPRRGTLTVEHATGGQTLEWFACKPAHVKGAVEAVHARAIADTEDEDDPSAGDRVEV